MPAAFDEQERLAIGERLLLGALDALRRGGLSASNVEQLARAAGIAKGSFYAFYPSKEALFMAALERIEAEYRLRFAEALGASGSPVERLKKALRKALEMVEEEPALRFLDAQAAERLARALPPERIAAHAAGDAEAAERILSAWRAEGVARSDLKAEELGGALYAVFVIGSGLRGLPPELAGAVRTISIEGLSMALAADPADLKPGKPDNSGGQAVKKRGAREEAV